MEEQKEGGPLPVDSEYNTYLKDTYGPYLTDSGYDRFVMTNQALLFHGESQQIRLSNNRN